MSNDLTTETKADISLTVDDLQIFNFDGHNVRTVIRGGEPWWVLKDVCDVLGISKYRDCAARLDADEREPFRVDTPGGKQEMTVINESGLYNVILRSDKPEAKRFKKWVTGEVLPQIRKTGSYSVPRKTPNELVLEAMQYLQSEVDKERTLRLAAEKQIAADTPFTVYGKQVGLDGDCRLNEGVQVVGKFLRQNGCPFGQVGLAQYLEDHHYVFRNGEGSLEPKAEYCQQGSGLFWMKQTAVNVPVSEKYPTGVRQRRELRFTTRGKMYFLRKLCPPPQSFPQITSLDTTWSSAPAEAGGAIVLSDELGNDVTID
jgi:prophage antirepressor-like protein